MTQIHTLPSTLCLSSMLLGLPWRRFSSGRLRFQASTPASLPRGLPLCPGGDSDPLCIVCEPRESRGFAGAPRLLFSLLRVGGCAGLGRGPGERGRLVLGTRCVGSAPRRLPVLRSFPALGFGSSTPGPWGRPVRSHAARDWGVPR